MERKAVAAHIFSRRVIGVILHLLIRGKIGQDNSLFFSSVKNRLGQPRRRHSEDAKMRWAWSGFCARFETKADGELCSSL